MNETLPDISTLNSLLGKTVGRWDICPFWILRGKMFSFAEKALIIALLDMWHTTGRVGWFYITNAELERLAGMSHPVFLDSRKNLIKKCVIKVNPGKRGRPKQGVTGRATCYQISQEFLHTLISDQPAADLQPKLRARFNAC